MKATPFVPLALLVINVVVLCGVYVRTLHDFQTTVRRRERKYSEDALSEGFCDGWNGSKCCSWFLIRPDHPVRDYPLAIWVIESFIMSIPGTNQEDWRGHRSQPKR